MEDLKSKSLMTKEELKIEIKNIVTNILKESELLNLRHWTLERNITEELENISMTFNKNLESVIFTRNKKGDMQLMHQIGITNHPTAKKVIGNLNTTFLDDKNIANTYKNGVLPNKIANMAINTKEFIAKDTIVKQDDKTWRY